MPHHTSRLRRSRRQLLRLSLAGLLGGGVAFLEEVVLDQPSAAPPAAPLVAQQNATSKRPPEPTGVPPRWTPQSAAPTTTPTPVSQRTTIDDAERRMVHVPAPRPPIITSAEWNAEKPARAFLPQRPHRITLHHEGVYFDGSTPVPDYLRHVQAWSIKNRKWPDIPYHFMIDLEGRIYQGRPLEARGDTSTSYNLQDHALVALIGNYDAGEQEPRQVQIDMLIAVMAWIADMYQIPPELIHGHRDFIPLNDKLEHIDPRTGEKITCPGDNLYRYLADRTIQSGVARILARTRPAPYLR